MAPGWILLRFLGRNMKKNAPAKKSTSQRIKLANFYLKFTGGAEVLEANR